MFFSFLLLLWMQQTRKIAPIKKKKKQKTNKSQNYNFTCVHQRPENKQGILKPEEDKKTK